MLGSTASAGYKSQKVKVESAGNYPSHVKQGSLTIAANPYQTWEKLKTVFDIKELDRKGVIPIHVIITNEGEETIAVNGEDIHLLDSKNHSIEGLSTEDVVRFVSGKTNPGSSRNPPSSPFPLPRTGGRRGDIFEIETDLTNKSLREVRVSPKSTVGGFVYFQLPDMQRDLRGHKIYIPEIKNVRSGESLLFFEIELK